MQTSKLKVKYTSQGLANFYGDYIEINYKLKKDKELRDYILRHELGHSKEFDLGHEIADSFILLRKPKILLKLISFYIKNPSSLRDMLPIQFKQKKMFIDLNLMILYGLSMGLIITLLFIFKIS